MFVFRKLSSLAKYKVHEMSSDLGYDGTIRIYHVIVVVEYRVGDGLGHVRYYLAPKMEED